MYQAKNMAGQIQIGQVVAVDENEARLKIKLMKLEPLTLKNADGPLEIFIQGVIKNILTKRAKSEDLQIFTRQLSTLISSGIPIVDALKMLGNKKKPDVISIASVQVKEAIESGKRLGDAMAAHPHVFDRFFVNMIRAGEEAGILDDILKRLSTYMEKAEKIKKQVSGAMMYPIIIMIVAALVVAAILIFVIPQFEEFYKGSGKELPAMTQIVVGMSDFMRNQWYILILISIAVPYAFMFWKRTPAGKAQWDRFLIRTPVFGEIVQKSAVAKMTRTLSTLLSSGVGMIEAIDIAAKTAGNGVIEETLNRCRESVTSGRPLASPLAKEKMIPDMVSQMVTVGESSGTLDIMLGKIADFYEDDVEAATKGLTSLIEPLLMVFLGGIIAFIVTAMYLPIFDMANIAGGQ